MLQKNNSYQRNDAIYNQFKNRKDVMHETIQNGYNFPF